MKIYIKVKLYNVYYKCTLDLVVLLSFVAIFTTNMLSFTHFHFFCFFWLAGAEPSTLFLQLHY